MHASLQSLLRLYREPLPEGTPPAHEDADAVAALAAVRDALDARTASGSRARPDAFVLDQILAAASHGAPVGPPESLGVRFDRQSVPRRPARFRRAFALVLTGSVAALAAVVVWLPGGGTDRAAAPAPVVALQEAPAAVAVPAAVAPTEATALAAPVAAAAPASVPTAPPAAASLPVAPTPTVEPSAPAPDASLAADADTWDAPAAKEAVATAATKAQRLAARVDSTLWELPSTSSLALPRTGAPSPYTPATHTGNDW